ncbi:MAG: hypothetical protein M1833_001916 [Piccolia ochrophora]|nr:MAG: hypothetical protein M1833_001916 [Piccolia ochrophora]
MQNQAAELKQQGALEAARANGNSLASEDAERKIVEETKKAGYEAYEFNPNASPEEKAAQAHSHVPNNFHHERRHKAIGLTTDIDDGTPDQIELPAPSKAGALAASPTVGESKDGLGNGTLSKEDNDRWVERSGWAPRFGTGKDADTEEGTLLDHQTWLEGRLDEKFYGGKIPRVKPLNRRVAEIFVPDWYQNTGVIVFACLTSWLVAVLGGGLAWIFLVMAFCGTYYRTSIRRVRRNFRDDVNRELAKTKLETDHESLEWINSFLVKFWPIFQPVLSETVINSVDQVLSTATPAFLDSLRLKTFTLGSKPPRLDHVKTYPKAEDDVVLMDWKFSFTPNDTADFTARQIKNKINPKIVLEVRIGKLKLSKGLDVIVEDMACSGLIRVKVKLQIPFPHVEKIEVCFLEEPTIDYVCKPLGGDMLGFDINFIPGLESFIMGQIHANLSPIMYAPNVFPIEVAKMIAGDAVDQAIGVIAVTMHGAHGLKNPDKFSGTPDPYVSVALNAREILARTATVKENANPRWNETKYIIVTSLKDSLTMQVYDYNDFRKDKELGTAAFALEEVEDEPEHENLQLEVMSNGKARGVLQVDVRFFPVMEGRKLEDGTVEPPPESNTGIAKFTVEQAKDLDGTKSLIGRLNPYAILLLNGKEVHSTQRLKSTNNPIWPNGTKDVLITDRKAARLGLAIKDDRGLVGDPILGTYQIKLNDMLQMMEKGQEWYSLAGAKTGRAKFTLQWKPVALKGVVGGTGGYVTPIGVMRVHLQKARELRNLETMGKSDPYVRVLLSGVEKGRTVTFANNLNPEWDEVIYVPVHSTREKLTLEVMDAENLGKDRSLGSVEVAASEYISQAESGEYNEESNRKPLASPLRLHGKGSPKGTLNYTISFYPCLNVADPEEEEEERLQRENDERQVDGTETPRQNKEDETDDPELAEQLNEGEKEQEESVGEKELPKIRLSPEELVKHESGLIIFKLIEGDFSHTNCRVEVVIDDMRFPSYISSKAKSRHTKFDEIGDTFVRELDVSRITMRLREKPDSKGDDKHDATVAKLTGDTLGVLKQCLNNPAVLSLRDSEGGVSKIKVSLKYIPVKMQLDPAESINNMGNLRVDVLDAENLPAADRNGYSDPYCKFELNGKEVFKTNEQKKTLHPAWNEYFEVPVPSRIGANFSVTVFDWDAVGNDDLLGKADINLELLDPMAAHEYKLNLDGKSGTIRLRLVFRPDYVTRSRQGTSTFHGTFATPGKIVTGVAGAPIKGVGMVGGGVAKGASVLRRGFRSKKKGEDVNGSMGVEEVGAPSSFDTPLLSVEGNGEAPATPPKGERTLTGTPPHARSASFGARSFRGSSEKPNGIDTGSAHFTLLSAAGYPQSAHVRVQIKQVSGRGSKEIFKSKSVKSSSGAVQWEKEAFKYDCTPDTQFQLQVKDHSTFRSEDLGEAVFYIDDSSAGSEKTIKAGSGSVVLRTSFMPPGVDGTTDSPKGRSGARRSFLSKSPKDSRERGETPT